MKKVIIIGAGPAGLSAAYKLLKESKEYEVIILEATNDIGGISRTVKYKGNRMDIGGHRFFTKDKEVQKFWNEVMPIQGKTAYDDKILNRKKELVKGGPDPEKDNRVMLIRNRVSRIYYTNKFFDYPVSLKWSTIKNLGFLKTMQSGFSYLKSTIFKKKEDSLENFYINRFGKKLYSMFFEKYTEKLWGRHPKEISADWGTQRVKGLSIKTVLKDMFSKVLYLTNNKKETSLIEEFQYPKYGPGDLWENVSYEIEKMGGKIYKNHEVQKIEIKNKKIKSVTTCDENNVSKKFDGDIFISSMPIKDLINSINDKIPNDITRIANGLPYRDFVTVGLLVNKLKLKNETNIKTLQNIIPDCWIYVQESKVKMGRIQIFNNWSPYMVKDPNNTVWIGLEYFCNENDDFWNMSDKECVDLAIKELVKMKIIEESDVLDYHREKVKKAYPAYFDTYDEIDKVIDYLNSFDNLYCVGRNGQHRYNNMDHSVATSFEAVKNIIENKKEKDNVWNVNTEKVYHEEQKEEKIKEKIKLDFNIPLLCKKNFYLLYLLPFIFFISNPWFIDNDSWFLLNHGRYVLENGFPTIEPFTIHENMSFVMQQWLFSTILWIIKNKFGFNALFVMCVVVNALLILTIHKLCMLVSNNNYKISIIITTIIDILLIKGKFITTRPQIISFILITLFIYFIEKYRKTGNRRNLYFLPLISVLQINMHASMWVFLYIYSLPFVAEAIIKKFITKNEINYKIAPLIILLIISILFGFINPYGIKSMSYFFTSLNKYITNYIYEMKPITITSLYGLSIFFSFTIAISIEMYNIYKNKKLNISYMLLLFGSFILALATNKSGAYFYIYALYPLAYMFKSNAPQEENKKVIKEPIYNKIFRLVYLIVIFISFTVCLKINLDEPEYMKEKSTIDYILNEYDKTEIKMYCSYDIGGYLEYRGIKTYIDPRAEVFYKSNNNKEEIFDEYYELQGSTLDIKTFLEKYNFTHLFLDRNDYLYNLAYMQIIENNENFYGYKKLLFGYEYMVLVKDENSNTEESKEDNLESPEKTEVSKKKQEQKNNNKKKNTKDA